MFNPDPIWEGKPAYIVGGGSSLKTFDWNLIRDEFVIGCNVAYLLGFEIIPITVFGDTNFFNQHRTGLENYAKGGGWVVTNSMAIRKPVPQWLRIMKKELNGFHREALGWNGNTGSVAINLALILGASPIFLLGFDMGVSEEGEANYHNAYPTVSSPDTYGRFLKRMERASRDLPTAFPGQKIINLEDGTSKMGIFPKEILRKHFERVSA